MSGILPHVSRPRDNRRSRQRFRIISWIVRHNRYLRTLRIRAGRAGDTLFPPLSLGLLKGVSNGCDEFVVIEGLDEKSSGTSPHHGGFGSAILMTRDENHPSLWRSRT